MSGNIFCQRLRKNGLVYNVSIDKSEYEASGIFCILTSVDNKKLITYEEDNTEKDLTFP